MQLSLVLKYTINGVAPGMYGARKHCKTSRERFFFFLQVAAEHCKPIVRAHFIAGGTTEVPSQHNSLGKIFLTCTIYL